MSMKPLTSLSSLTPGQVIPNATQAGVIPIGNYKGVAAFWDLDKANNQPLVQAEPMYIEGILSGREAAYDLVTVTHIAAIVAGTLGQGTITVPAGELWYVNAISMNCPGDAAAGFTMNWYCSLWTDRVGALGLGQPFHAPAHALANFLDPGNPITTHVIPGGGAINQLDEFGEISLAWIISNKAPLLRMPAGTVITFTVLTDTAPVAVATACTLGVFGSMAKVLVA